MRVCGIIGLVRIRNMKPQSNMHKEIMNDLNILAYLEMILDPLLAECARQWESHVEYNFDSEGGAVGSWPDIDKKTKELRVQLGYPPGPIMNMRGRLRKSYSIVSFVSFDGAGLSIVW